MWDRMGTEKHYTMIQKYSLEGQSLFAEDHSSTPHKTWFDEKFCQGYEPEGTWFFIFEDSISKIKGRQTQSKNICGTTNALIDERPECYQKDYWEFWLSLKAVIKRFLGNHRAGNVEQLINGMLKAYGKLGCRMSLKIHFPHFHFFSLSI